MQTGSIAELIVLLIVILIFLVFMLFINPRKKAKQEAINIDTSLKVTSQESRCITLECLLAVFKSKKSSAKELEIALDNIIKHHINIPAKLGVRISPEFEYYKDIFFYLCKHKNATTKMILTLDKELSSANPQYKVEINESIARGLEARRV